MKLGDGHLSHRNLFTKVLRVPVCTFPSRCHSGQIEFEHPRSLNRCFSHINGHLNGGEITLAQYLSLLRSMVRLICHAEMGEEVEHLFIKMTIFASVATPHALRILRVTRRALPHVSAH